MLMCVLPSDLTQTVGKHWIKSNNSGCSICRKSVFYTGVFVCVCVCVCAQIWQLLKHTHIRAKCNSSQWNVLTTKRPRIALVDNRTDTHTSSLFVCTAHQSSINTDYSDIDLFFASFIPQPSFEGVWIFTWEALQAPKAHTVQQQDQEHERPATDPDWSRLPCSVAALPSLHRCCCCHHQHVFSINNPTLLRYCDKCTHDCPRRYCSVTFPTHCFSSTNEKDLESWQHTLWNAHRVPPFCSDAFLRKQINTAWLTHLRPNNFSQQEVGMRQWRRDKEGEEGTSQKYCCTTDDTS